MRTLILKGGLGATYGERLVLDFDTPAQAIRAVGLQNPKFVEDLREGFYRMYRGAMPMDEDLMDVSLGKVEEVTILPVPKGEKSQGLGKVLLGLTIVTLAFVTAGTGTIGALAGLKAGLTSTIAGTGVTWGSVAIFGGALTAAGLAALSSPIPEVADFTQRERPDERASPLLNSQVNTAEQGVCVPVPYGRTLAGAHVISAGLNAEQIPVGEILNPEIDSSSSHWINCQEGSFLLELQNPDFAVSFRGYKHSVGIGQFNSDFSGNRIIEIGDTNDLARVGAIDPLIFRGSWIVCAGEWVRDDTNEHFFRIVMFGHRPQDYFETVKLTTHDEVTTHVDTLFTEVATNFRTGNIQTTFSFVGIADATIWEWSLGVGVPYSVPISTPTPEKLIFEY